MPPLVYQQLNDDYVDDLDPSAVTQLICEEIEQKHDGLFGHIYYGRVASASPVLNFAYFVESGIFLSINLGSSQSINGVFVFEASGDYITRHELIWGQDRVTIPCAFCMPVAIGLQIIEHFCRTGDKTDDPRWRDHNQVAWDWDTP